MKTWCKAGIAVALLPICLGASKALFKVFASAGRVDTIWVALLAGALCWWVIYLLLPKPMWVYVVGHELTHALWTWAFGGSVRGFKATARGGHVVVTKDNFLISLSPYFFPIYTIGVVAFFLIGHLIWGWTQYLVYFHLLFGATYAFHITLTWHILSHQQSDIVRHGRFFSAAVIWLANVLILMIALCALTQTVSLPTALGWWIFETGSILKEIGKCFF